MSSQKSLVIKIFAVGHRKIVDFPALAKNDKQLSFLQKSDAFWPHFNSKICPPKRQLGGWIAVRQDGGMDIKHLFGQYLFFTVCEYKKNTPPKKLLCYRFS